MYLICKFQPQFIKHLLHQSFTVWGAMLVIGFRLCKSVWLYVCLTFLHPHLHLQWHHQLCHWSAPPSDPWSPSRKEGGKRRRREMEVKEMRGEDRMGRRKKRDGRGGGRIRTSLSKSIIIFCNSGSFSRAFILAIAWKESGGRREMGSGEKREVEVGWQKKEREDPQ